MSALLTARPGVELSPDDLARLTEAALEVILRHGVGRPSVEVELDLWDALNRTYRSERRLARWLSLTNAQAPSRQKVLSTLAGVAFAVATDAGAGREDLLRLELDLLFALQLVEVNEKARAVLVG